MAVKPNQERNLAAISKIDDEIIEKQTKQRIRLLGKAQKSRRSFKKWYIMGGSIAAAAVLVLVSTLLIIHLISSPDVVIGKQVPVYTGMTVSNTAPTHLLSGSALEFASEGNNGNGSETADDNGNHNGHYKGDYKQEQEIPEEPFPDKPLASTLTVLGADDGYYAKPGEDVYITVHLSNPDKFEILSFTLNGEKYSSYMFEDGSDLENLILKVNVGQTEGMITYTIDAIKYVEGEAIKDVRMEGDQTVEIGVYTDQQPTVAIGAVSVGFNSFGFTVSGTDEMNLIASSNGKVEAVLYDGDAIVAKREISLTEGATVTFEELSPNTLYQYAVVASYDALDGKGYSSYILKEEAFYTKAPVLFDGVTLSATGVTFALDWHADATGTVKRILLSDGTTERELAANATAVDGLLPDTAYTLTVTYENGGRTEQITLELTTAPLTYTVAHLKEALDGSYETVSTATAIIKLGESVTPEVQTFEGFTSPAAITVVGETGKTLEAIYYYERTVYTLTLVHNDGTAPEVLSLKYGHEIPGDAREGFGGWFRDETLTEAIPTVPAEDVTLYAKWESATSAELLNYTGLDTLTVIGLREGVTITELVIPSYIGGKRVSAIADRAFNGCAQLARVVVPPTVTRIGQNAFGGCSGLDSLSIPFVGASAGDNGATYLGYIFGAAKAEDNGYYVPSSLKSVEVTGEAAIASGAFTGCVWLENVTLCDAVTGIGEGAFTGCSSLKSMTLPFVGDRLKSETDSNQYPFGYIFGRTAFDGATATEQCYRSVYNAETGIWTTAAAEDSTYYIPDTLTSVTVTGGYIPYKAFYNCAHLTDIAVSGDVLYMAMGNCTALTSVTLCSGVTKLETSAFDFCTALTTLHIPAYVKELDARSLGTYITNVTLDADHPVFYLQDNCLINRETKTLVRAFAGFTIPADGSVEIIGGYALRKRIELTELTVPAVIKSLGNFVFAFCTNLTTVHFAEGSPVTVLPGYAFFGCTLLSEVTLPAGLLTIGGGSFQNCTALAEITLPASLELIRSQGFYGCTALSAVVIPADSCLTAIGSDAFQGSGITAISLPATLATLSVNAFRDCTALQTVTFPADSALTAINSYTFGGCTALTTVNIPASVERIYNNAFKDCTSLSDLTIAEGVSTIIGNAFLNCTGLKKLVLPSSLTVIGTGAFSGCAGLQEITVPFVGNKPRTAEETWQYSFGCIFGSTAYNGGKAISQSYYGDKASTGALSIATTTYYIPAGLTKVTVTGGNILRGAFQNCTMITDLTLPEDLTSIGDYALQNCTGLTDFEIPASVKSIGMYAFMGCTALNRVNYAGTLADWCGIRFANATANPLSLRGALYIDGVNVTSGALTIPDGVTSIGAYAFYNCSGVTELTVPASVTTIGTDAFGGSVAPVKATIPMVALSKIAKTALQELELLNGTALAASALKNCTTLKSLKLPAMLTSIGDYALQNCTGLTDIEIPSSVTSIGIAAFSGCSALGEVELPTSLKSVGMSAFSGCSALGEIKLPTSLKSIGISAFSGCSALSKIEIPTSVTSVGENAFAGCIALNRVDYAGTLADWCGISFVNTDANPLSLARALYMDGVNVTSGVLTIPDGVTSIGAYAFYNCSGVTELTVPASVTTIGTDAFGGSMAPVKATVPMVALSKISKTALQELELLNGTTLAASALKNCTTLKSLKLPTTLTSIGDYALQNCTGLTDIEIPSSVTSIGSYAFYCAGLTSALVPEGVTAVGDYAFRACTSLTELYLPQSLTAISERIWSGCSALKKVTMPYITTSLPKVETLILLEGTVTTVAAQQFYLDKTVKNITFPDNVTEIGTEAFCHSLIKTVTFGENSQLTTIGVRAFDGCDNLLNFTVPSAVIDISDYAFGYCDHLLSVTIPAGVIRVSDSAFTDCSLAQLTNLSGKTIKVRAIETRTSLDTPFVGVIHEDAEGYVTYTYGDGATSLMCYVGTATDLDLTRCEKTITAIRSCAFDSCKSLTSIVLNDELLSIGSEAFTTCTNLHTVTISENSKLSSIGYMAFEYCQNLKNFYIPASVTDIWDFAFHDAGLLTVTFADPTGWTEYSEDRTWSGAVSQEILADPVKAAEFLCDEAASSWLEKESDT